MRRRGRGGQSARPATAATGMRAHCPRQASFLFPLPAEGKRPMRSHVGRRVQTISRTALERRVVTRAGSARPFPAGSVPVRVWMRARSALCCLCCLVTAGCSGGVWVGAGRARSSWAAKKRGAEKREPVGGRSRHTDNPRPVVDGDAWVRWGREKRRREV
jgi:hypothetical protein